MGQDRRKSPAREGPALLQGLILCGRCGQRMTVRYHVRHGRLWPEYLCQREGIEHAQPLCQRVPGGGIDEAIGELLVEAVSPVALEMALTVQQELQSRLEEADRLRQKQVERAVTVSANPFSPVTDTVKTWLTPPIVATSCAGDTTKLKSFAAVTVSFSEAACDNPPLVPITVMLESPTAVDAGTVSVTFCIPPAATVNGEAGVLVVPDGNPESETLAEPENPFRPAMEITAGALVPPACCVSSAGEALIVKSAAGGGGSAVPPPPHAATTDTTIASAR